MEHLIETIGDKVLNEAGLVAALLLIALVWAIRQWKEEAKAHRETIERVFTMADKMAAAGAASAEAMNLLKNAASTTNDRLSGVQNSLDRNASLIMNSRQTAGRE